MQFRTFSAHFRSNLVNSVLLVAFLFEIASKRNLPGTDRFWRHFFHPTWPSSGPVLPHLRPQKSVPARQVRTCLPHFPHNLSNSVFLCQLLFNNDSESQSAWHGPIPAAPFPLNLALFWSCPDPSAPSGIRLC